LVERYLSHLKHFGIIMNVFVDVYIAVPPVLRAVMLCVNVAGPVSEMTYNVLSGTLNFTHSLTLTP